MIENSKEHAPKRQRPPLMLCHYLNPHSLFICEGSVQKESLIDQMINSLVQDSPVVEADRVRQAVWDREREGRTVLENGLAIPHARILGLKELKASLAILPQGYLDPQENVLVRLVFLFLSPQEQFETHLQMLAKISRLFQDAQFQGQLLSVKSAEEAFQLIQRQERV